MEFDNRKPVFTQLVDIILNDIYKEVYKPGDKLPSVREFANLYTINPNTVLSSFKELLNKDIIYTKRGIGYFVSEDASYIELIKKEKLNQILDEFIKSMKDIGLNREDVLKIIKEADFND